MAPFNLRHPLDLTTLRIEGERVVLLSNHERFAEAIFREFSSDITTYMMPRPAEVMAETLEFVRSSIASAKAGSDITLAICALENEEFLGMCGLHGRGSAREPELGIWLKASAHGHGYGREAIHTLVAWASETIALEAFLYPVDKRNTPSRKIPESLAGVIVAERQEENMSGALLDEVVYRISPAPSI